MIDNNNLVMCCFCGESINLDLAVQIEIKPSLISDETQAVYCHRKCIDRMLHKNVPRHPDLIANE